MTFLEVVKRMLVTRKCLLCKEPISYEEKEPFCEECTEHWNKLIDAKCHRCGYKVNECSCSPSRIRAIGGYGAVYCVFYDAKSSLQANSLVFNLKRDYDKSIIKFCAGKIAKNFLLLSSRHSIDYKDFTVTYVTRRKKGRRKYGFDHSKELAKALAAILGIKCEQTVINIGETEQKTLTKVQRQENAEKSYVYYNKADVKGKSYILVDDIITSGATMKACADILKNNGANVIIPVAFAKDNR